MVELTNINIMKQTTYETIETKSDNELYFTDADSYVDGRITYIMDSKLQVVSSLPSSPTTGVFYFIPE